MFDDEPASAKKISLFLVWLQGEVSVIYVSTKLKTNVQTPPPPTFVNLVTIHYWVFFGLVRIRPLGPLVSFDHFGAMG